MSTLREFVAVYVETRAVHGVRYSIWLAWQIAIKGTPF